jgi:DNA invertase Pin-like site-specific DNA recombinase
MKTKCVTYSRVSTDLQSTKSQLSDLKRYAINNDFIVVKDFEESVSGFITERDALEALKVFIKVHIYTSNIRRNRLFLKRRC